MKINEDGRWGILKLSNTFWPRSLQGPEHGGSGYVHMLPGFLGRKITESVVAFLRRHQARRQSNAHAERMEPSDAVGAMPGLRNDFCQDLQGGRRKREAGPGPRLPRGCGIYRRLSRPGDAGGRAGMDARSQHPELPRWEGLSACDRAWVSEKRWIFKALPC